ncbi:Afadin and alpha-actinin-binding-domain-containing protein [Phycomyces blakesleeanus]|uniref:Afadin and alpha-actinin-binding-domain-containing protein n=1 Tax=Phycomyces blakesleeanus TaxID=4837 RepID=A0ABR3B5W5_PHYBL
MNLRITRKSKPEICMISGFCTPANLASSANHVNIQLTAQGYPVPLVFKSNQPEDACKIINCLHDLLQDKKNDEEQCNELSNTISQLKRDREVLQQKFDLQSQELTKIKREKELLGSKVDSIQKNLKTEKEQTKSMKDELNKAKNNMQYIKAQYAHETRRHELEHAKTRDRLSKLMREKIKPVLPSIIVNDPPPGLAGHPKENAAEEERAMFEDLIIKTSAREMDARKESEAFRKAFVAVYSAVRNLLDRQILEDESHTGKESKLSRKDMSAFRLPFDFGGSEAVQHIHDLLVRLEEEWGNQTRNQTVYTAEDVLKRDRMIRQLEHDIEILIKTFDEATVEYEEKTRMYKRFEEGGFFDVILPAIPNEQSDSEDFALEIQLDSQNRLERLRKTALKDQRRVTDAAIRLGNERKMLKAERWAFEEMKRELKMKDILSERESSPEDTVRPQHPLPSPSRPRKRHRPGLGKAPTT